MKTYYFDDEQSVVSQEQLDALGVLYWKLDADNWEAEGTLDKIRTERSYKNHDVITVSKEGLGDQYEAKLKIFFEEHIHEDEEIRFVLDGSGFFDVRDKDDRWVRCAMEKGDMIVLPAGIYHRFTLDDKAYIKAMRLFQDDPKWTALNRAEKSTQENPHRLKYAAAVGAV